MVPGFIFRTLKMDDDRTPIFLRRLWSWVLRPRSRSGSVFIAGDRCNIQASVINSWLYVGSCRELFFRHSGVFAKIRF